MAPQRRLAVMTNVPPMRLCKCGGLTASDRHCGEPPAAVHSSKAPVSTSSVSGEPFASTVDPATATRVLTSSALFIPASTTGRATSSSQLTTCWSLSSAGFSKTNCMSAACRPAVDERSHDQSHMSQRDSVRGAAEDDPAAAAGAAVPALLAPAEACRGSMRLPCS